MRLRHLTVYETAAHFYIVGSDASQKRYHLLKVDRMDPRRLVVGETGHEYSKSEIMEVLATVSEGSSIVYKSQHEKSSSAVNKRKGLVERVSSAFGLLGAVRFLEGYYLLFSTKARVVASLGYHSIYKIEEVAMIYVPAGGPSGNAEEQRYVKLFQSVDLTTDFYFSYTYDLSRTLQENVCGACGWPSCAGIAVNIGNKVASEPKFIWNCFLLEPLRTNLVTERWMLEIVHGYVGQQIIELPCSQLSLTLIGRRSSEYAGTRYLKRGANLKGHVANDVETEQIIWDVSSSPNFRYGKFSAFVQRRGSVPLLWSQDPTTRGVVGKPLISIDINEPHAQTAAAHFRELRNKYGTPVIVMNLVKRREKRKHEAVLHDQFLKAVRYLNLFVPRSERIAYLSFDVARCNKTGSVLNKLEEIGFRAVLRHGWFQSFPPLFCHKVRPSSLLAGYEPRLSPDGRLLLQMGISRTNCVDCLDRTNVAQFGIGKVALGMQLYSMGFSSDPTIQLSSEVCRIFEDLMDEHGDTMALQYAGSQLVHSIKTYRKIAAFQERSRDVIQTLSRYYSNTFGDYDKQNAINLFLGIYRPGTLPHLWDLGTDYYLHFPIGTIKIPDYCAWFIEDDLAEPVVESPEEYYAMSKSGSSGLSSAAAASPDTISSATEVKPMELRVQAPLCVRSDLFNDEQFYAYYRLWEITNFDGLIREQKDLQKSVTIDGVQQSVAQSYSFAKLWRTDSAGKNNSVVLKQEKTALTDDEDEEDEPIVKSDSEIHYECEFNMAPMNKRLTVERTSNSRETSPNFNISLKKGLLTGLKTTFEAYGVEIKTPSESDMLKYMNCAQLVDRCSASQSGGISVPDVSNRFTLLKPMSLFTMDSTFQIAPPEVSRSSMKTYTESVECARGVFRSISAADRNAYDCFSLQNRESALHLIPYVVKTSFS